VTVVRMMKIYNASCIIILKLMCARSIARRRKIKQRCRVHPVILHLLLPLLPL
jgi:hypothetical protein